MNMQRLVFPGRVFMCLWVLFVLPTVASVLQSGLSPIQLGVAFGFVTWGGIWVWHWIRAVGHGGEAVGLISNTVILTLFAIIAPAPVFVGGVLVFAFMIAGLCFPWRTAVWIMFGLALLQIALMAIRRQDLASAASSLLNGILVGGVGIGARLLWESYMQLLAAREQLAHLAVTEERLRFARDLHDLLGQSLSVLVLKSELVAKQLPADADEPLRREVRDIAQVARKSLNDVRETVAGYRKPTLQAEISNARTALDAAGIGLVVDNSIDAVAPDQDGVLAWCLREAVTNVVKHSGATKCEVRLARDNGSATLDVWDDGRGATTLDGGSGLVGMRERVEMVGGKLDVASGISGFHLVVTVPRGA